MVLVPLLLKWCKIDEKRALATSVSIIMPLCALSAAIYIAKNGLPGGIFLYAAGGLAGGIAAGVFMKKVPATLLVKIFGAIMALSGVKMLIWG